MSIFNLFSYSIEITELYYFREVQYQNTLRPASYLGLNLSLKLSYTKFIYSSLHLNNSLSTQVMFHTNYTFTPVYKLYPSLIIYYSLNYAPVSLIKFSKIVSSSDIAGGIDGFVSSGSFFTLSFFSLSSNSWSFSSLSFSAISAAVKKRPP